MWGWEDGMPRAASQLTSAKVKALLDKGLVGRHPDGNRLYLVVTGQRRGWWMLRYTLGTRSTNGKVLSREMGLGGADAAGVDGFTLAESRHKAEDARRLLRDGIDPLAQRNAAKAAQERASTASKTFRQTAEAYIPEAASGWSNPKHAAQRKATLETYAYPARWSEITIAAINSEKPTVRRVTGNSHVEKKLSGAAFCGSSGA